ncbi:N-acetyltransferase [Pseudorhizobium endolithicum]|uniref:N-acetyltransferase n=1 Tax=Pseudorhizobium endolithicum TaxID=1191678 RepID=A0ABN7JD77_9HYPH|nr:GNAT family N-acetyltransferase [Pseudorhizobium endolithicum]CAD7024322.1 N-acetyltransferase [Pseudorhizobium endolithicum]
MLPELTITDHFTPEEEQAILDRLQAYNIENFGPTDRKDLAILLRDDAGEPEGGLLGRTGRGWLYVQMLFVPEHLRGQGLAKRLLSMAEEEARRRGCVGAYLDTMNPQAMPFYLKQGYEIIGTLEGLTGGHSVTWLKKRL